MTEIGVSVNQILSYYQIWIGIQIAPMEMENIFHVISNISVHKRLHTISLSNIHWFDTLTFNKSTKHLEIRIYLSFSKEIRAAIVSLISAATCFFYVKLYQMLHDQEASQNNEYCHFPWCKNLNSLTNKPLSMFHSFLRPLPLLNFLLLSSSLLPSRFQQNVLYKINYKNAQYFDWIYRFVHITSLYVCRYSEYLNI